MAIVVALAWPLTPHAAKCQSFVLEQTSARTVLLDTTAFRALGDGHFAVRFRYQFAEPQLMVKSLSPVRTAYYALTVIHDELWCEPLKIRTIDDVAYSADGDVVRRGRASAFETYTPPDSAEATYVRACALLDSLPRPAKKTAIPLTAAQEARRVASGLSNDFVTLISATADQGFDLHPAGYLDPNFPQEYLGRSLVEWLHRNRTLGRSIKCERVDAREVTCGYVAANEFVDALGTDVADGRPIRVDVRFRDSVSVAIDARFPRDLFGSRSDGSLDESLQRVLTVLHGPPSAREDLTDRYTEWASARSRVIRVVNSTASTPVVDWLWVSTSR